MSLKKKKNIKFMFAIFIYKIVLKKCCKFIWISAWLTVKKKKKLI
jgi:hypothetical protein